MDQLSLADLEAEQQRLLDAISHVISSELELLRAGEHDCTGAAADYIQLYAGYANYMALHETHMRLHREFMAVHAEIQRRRGTQTPRPNPPSTTDGS